MTGQARQPASTAAQQRELQRRLDAIVELHSGTVVELCTACLLPSPCPTVQLATGVES